MMKLTLARHHRQPPCHRRRCQEPEHAKSDQLLHRQPRLRRHPHVLPLRPLHAHPVLHGEVVVRWSPLYTLSGI